MDRLDITHKVEEQKRKIKALVTEWSDMVYHHLRDTISRIISLRWTPPKMNQAELEGYRQFWNYINAVRFTWDMIDRKGGGTEWAQKIQYRVFEARELPFRIREYAIQLMYKVPGNRLYHYLRDCLTTNLEQTISKWDGSLVDASKNSYRRMPTTYMRLYGPSKNENST